MSIRTRVYVTLLTAAPILFAAIAIILGKKTGWDLFNYHWYNPFALLNNRFGFDVAVGHHATYYNPLSDLPLYFIGSMGPAWLGGAFMGAMAGVVVSLIGAIAFHVLPIANTTHRTIVAAVLALAGSLGAGAFQEIGDPANDIPAAIGALIALYVLISQHARLQQPVGTSSVRLLLVAGMCAGAGVGLKLTTAVFAFGVVAALLPIPGSLTQRLRRTTIFGGGAIVGVLLLGGFWMLRMWHFSGNPFFPYFNDIFQSPLLVTTGYLDPSFHPANWTIRLLFPFFFTVDSHYVSESGFRDAHVLALYVLIPLTLILNRFWKTPTAIDGPVATVAAANLLFAFAGASYVAWLFVFDVYRYLIPLEMLAPLLIALAVSLWPLKTSARIAITAATLIALQAVVRIDLSDRQTWSGPYVQVDAPAIADPAHTMILMTGHEAMAFVIPSFPHEIPFLRIDGWLVQGNDRSTGLARAMRARVAAHRGPLYVLFSNKEIAAAQAATQSYNLTLDMGAACSRVVSTIADPLALCPATRITQQKH